MTSYPIDIGTLLSPRAEILYSKWRYDVRKRIVRLNGDTFVLCRFRSGRVLDHFEKTLRRIAEGGVSIQPVMSRTSSWGERLRYGHWIALGHVPGVPLTEHISQGSIASLGRNLGRLHSLQGPANRALFNRYKPQLPHEAFLACHRDLSDDEKDWIRASLARLGNVSKTDLTHGDLFGSNIICADDQSVSLIDYELLAYEASGIELAGCLLRNYCRLKSNRPVFLRAYLEECSPQLHAAWESYGQDLLFAAAARLSLQRRQRMRSIRIRNHLNQIQRWLWPFANKKSLRQRHDNNAALFENRRESAGYYEHVARATIDLCRKNPELGPLKLLRRINKDGATTP